MPKELRKADLNSDRFGEILESAARGADYRVTVPGVGIVRILPEPEQMATDDFRRFLEHPEVVRRLDKAVASLDAGEEIRDEDMDDLFDG